jgi:septal ring factor EnvC (AmiA/AmiB activator)
VSDHSSREWARQARQAEERRRDEERRKRDAEREHEKQMELIKLQVSPSRSTSLHLRADLAYPLRCAVLGCSEGEEEGDEAG